mmetsp:Transcript_7850/g.24064  ORF Transcript_7850/g.24064 Transcript_7850/m.24064 type:complete len:186 (+) Transcript_7850:234-791(+)
MKEETKEDEPLLPPASEFAEQVDRAYKFLTHPKVASASLEKRIAFLQSKECSREVIEAALKRAELAETPVVSDQEAIEEGAPVRPKTKKHARRKTTRTPEGRSTVKRRRDKTTRSFPVTTGCVACCLVLAIIIGLYFLLLHLNVLPPTLDLLDDRDGRPDLNASLADADPLSFSLTDGPSTYSST